MAASKERMVSSGRSHRERVGLDRSGSTAAYLANVEMMGPMTAGKTYRLDCPRYPYVEMSVGIVMWASRAQQRLKIVSDAGMERMGPRTGLKFVHGRVGICLG